MAPSPSRSNSFRTAVASAGLAPATRREAGAQSDNPESSYSDDEGADCVEVAVSADIHVRDSKASGGPQLHITTPAWKAFISAVQPGA
ncbi:DUF397 domain-containing protein [Streptomyces griseochromogenes]|uniref:DUF397 domain-containing protein n=1 Tax=Streptomyces griseochromogenes TaxID=68214 RepID=UPI00099F9DB8|nr:DUF397 domain-containing protein [Streptomyces griseochromogenes]